MAQPHVLWNLLTTPILSGVAVSENSSALNQLSERQAALAAALLDAVRHTAGAPAASADAPSPASRTRPVGRFALLSTQQLLTDQPAFASMLDEQTLQQAQSDSHHLTAVDLDAHSTEPMDELADALWPEQLDGGVIIAEIPGASEGEAASTMLAAAGALLTGETWCLVRAVDAPAGSPTRVGPNLVPQLVAALQASLGMGLPQESISTDEPEAS